MRIKPGSSGIGASTLSQLSSLPLLTNTEMIQMSNALSEFISVSLYNNIACNILFSSSIDRIESQAKHCI